MATLTYDGTDFLATLGGLPGFSRIITPETDPITGKVVRLRHVIRLEWHAVPDHDTTDAMQDDITAFEAALEAFDNGKALVFLENDGDQAWAYDGTTGSANNHVTTTGLHITLDFPWGPAKHITNDPVVMTLEGWTQPCANDPVTGIGSLTGYAITEEWDWAGLVTVTYEGTLCRCESVADVKTVIWTLRDDELTPDARARFTAAGVPIGTGFHPTAATIRYLDDDKRCASFRFTYGGGAGPVGLKAVSLEIRATCMIIQNDVELDIEARYGYRGDWVGTGNSIGKLFGKKSSAGGWISGGIAGGTGPFGLGTAAGQEFSAVWTEAWNFAGVDVTQFLPPGAGATFITTDPVLSMDTTTNEIVSRKKIRARWIHDPDIMRLAISVQLDHAMPGLRWRRVMFLNANTKPPRPYPQESGYGPARVTFTVDILARLKYYTMPDLIKQDRTNVYRAEPNSETYNSNEPNQWDHAAIATRAGGGGLVPSRVMLVYEICDPSTVPGIKDLRVGSIGRMMTMRGAGTAPIDSVSGGAAVGAAVILPREMGVS